MVIPGYRFADPHLLQRALTHKSAAGPHNERLEFLGDAILNLAVAELLYHRFPDATEGQLSRLRTALVRQESLAAVARQLGLGPQLVLGPGELKSGGHQRESILSDALEAVIAAVYLDSGGLEICRELVSRWFEEPLSLVSAEQELRDNKTRLQEWLQARHLALPEYVAVEAGSCSDPGRFRVECRVPGVAAATAASATNKRQAEQLAAGLMLDQLSARRTAAPP